MEQICLIFDHVLTASGAYLAAGVGAIHGVVNGTGPIDLQLGRAHSRVHELVVTHAHSLLEAATHAVYHGSETVPAKTELAAAAEAMAAKLHMWQALHWRVVVIGEASRRRKSVVASRRGLPSRQISFWEARARILLAKGHGRIIAW